MKKLFALFTLLCISACASGTTQPTPLPPLTFSKYAPLNVNVAKIEVMEEYRSPMRTPNVEHLMPYSPADAVQVWVKDRLRASGPDKLLQVIIKDAKVIETELPKKSGISGFFTNDQDKRYDARVEVELRVYGEAALSEANTETVVTRTITIPENASVEQRKNAFARMILDLMEVMNANLEKNMFAYMGNYIRAER